MNLGEYHIAKGWEEQLDNSKSYLYKATKKMKKFSDCKLCPIEYKKGDMVLVKFNPRKFKALRGIHQNIVWNYKGPFMIFDKVVEILSMVELL